VLPEGDAVPVPHVNEKKYTNNALYRLKSDWMIDRNPFS
jgi:hypothetical protein